MRAKIKYLATILMNSERFEFIKSGEDLDSGLPEIGEEMEESGLIPLPEFIADCKKKVLDGANLQDVWEEFVEYWAVHNHLVDALDWAPGHEPETLSEDAFDLFWNEMDLATR